MAEVKNILNTVNANIISQILKNSDTGNLKGVETLFNDGEKVFNDTVSDATQNKKDIENAKNAVKNAKANDKNAQNMAHKKADYVKSGSVLYDVTATGKAKISGNKATIQIKDKSGKTGTAVFTYAPDGSYTSIITVGDVTTERVVDKNGKLREQVSTNNKTKIKVTNEYDSTGKINTQTETDATKPNWKLTRYFDDNGQKSRNVSTDGTKTTTTDFEYDKSGKCITEQIRTYNNSDPNTVYYRTNIFNGNKKTSIDNNPDGTKITTNYDLKGGKWVSYKQTVDKPALNTVNNDIRKQILDNVDKNDPKALQAFYNDGEKVYNDAVSDAKTNKQVAQTIQTKIKNESAAKNKNASVVANKKAGGVKKGSSLYGGTAIGKATIKNNVATIQIKDKNGKTGTSVYTYASDGSYTLKVTIGDTVTERVMDKNGTLRQMVTKNNKTGITVTNEYDATGKINSQTETDKNRPNWTLTRYFDDNGQKSRNVSTDGTRKYTTDFEYDKSGKCVTEQIRSFYLTEPDKMYYRTNIFDGDKKTSIDNAPDGTKVVTEYVSADGKWDARKKVTTKTDGTSEVRTSDGKKGGQRLVKVERLDKDGKLTGTTYNLQKFDENDKHVSTQMFSDENMKNKIRDYQYTYNQDGYKEKDEVIDYRKGQEMTTVFDAKTGNVASKSVNDIQTEARTRADINEALKTGTIDENQANIFNKYLDTLNNTIFEVATETVETKRDDRMTGTMKRGLSLKTFAQAQCDASNIKIGVKKETAYAAKEEIKDAQGKVVYVKDSILSEAEYNEYVNKNPNASGKFLSHTSEIEFRENVSGNMVGFKYGENTYYATAIFNPEAVSDDRAFTVRYLKEDAEGNITEISEDDPVIRSLNNPDPNGIIQRSLRNGTGALYVQNTNVSDNSDTSDVVMNFGGETVKFARKTAESLANVSSRYYTEDDAEALAKYNADLNKYSFEKINNEIVQKLGNEASENALKLFSTYNNLLNNTVFEVTTETVETKKDDKMTGTIKKGLSLATLAQAQCATVNITSGTISVKTYTAQEDIKVGGTVVVTKGKVLSENEYAKLTEKYPNINKTKFKEHTEEKTVYNTEDLSGNMVGFKYGENTYFAEARFNPDANRDDHAYTVRYWKQDANGGIVELDEDDPAIRTLNDIDVDSVMQKSLKDGTGSIYIENIDDANVSDFAGNFGGSTHKFVRKTTESLTGVSSRYYTEDDAQALADYNAGLKKLSHEDQKIIEEAESVSQPTLSGFEFMNKLMEKFLNFQKRK